MTSVCAAIVFVFAVTPTTLATGAKKTTHADSDRHTLATTEVALDSLTRRERMLHEEFEKEERLFESRQPNHKEANASAGSLLQQKIHANQEAVGRLRRKEKMLQRVAKQEQADFAERLSHYHPLAHDSAVLQQGGAHAGQASAGSQLQQKIQKNQEVVGRLKRKEKMLQRIVKQRHADFAERQSHYHPLANVSAVRQPGGAHAGQASAGSLLQQRIHANQEAGGRLMRKEKMLQRIAKQEEADFAERQSHYHPLAHGSAMLQKGGSHASQVKDTSDQLLRRLGRLQAREKQVQEDLYVRQPVHRPQMAPQRSHRQETERELKRRLNRLRTEAKEEHEAFLQSAKSQ